MGLGVGGVSHHSKAFTEALSDSLLSSLFLRISRVLAALPLYCTESASEILKPCDVTEISCLPTKYLLL